MFGQNYVHILYNTKDHSCLHDNSVQIETDLLY